jgi:hypothetical protein
MSEYVVNEIFIVAQDLAGSCGCPYCPPGTIQPEPTPSEHCILDLSFDLISHQTKLLPQLQCLEQVSAPILFKLKAQSYRIVAHLAMASKGRVSEWI